MILKGLQKKSQKISTHNLLKSVNPELENYTQEMDDMPLTGVVLRMSDIQMYEFLMLVERKYEVYFNADELESNNSFYNLKNIYHALINKFEKA